MEAPSNFLQMANEINGRTDRGGQRLRHAEGEGRGDKKVFRLKGYSSGRACTTAVIANSPTDSAGSADCNSSFETRPRVSRTSQAILTRKRLKVKDGREEEWSGEGGGKRNSSNRD